MVVYSDPAIDMSQSNHLRRREGGGGEGEGGGERVTRAYTVEVQTASVFYSRRVLSYIS